MVKKPLSEDMKLEKRSEYASADGYDVLLEVTYRRVRKVRALNGEQAKQFAADRERDYASRYYSSASHIFYEVQDVVPLEAHLTAARSRKDGGEDEGGDGGATPA